MSRWSKLLNRVTSMSKDMQIPKDNPIKIIYIKLVKDIIDSEGGDN